MIKTIVLIDLKGREAHRLPVYGPVPSILVIDCKEWRFGVAKLNGEHHYYQVTPENPPMGNPQESDSA